MCIVGVSGEGEKMQENNDKQPINREEVVSLL